MKSISKLFIFFSLCLTLLISGCGQSTQKQDIPAKTGYPVSWTETLDGQSTEMKVTTPPKHAVSMSQATTEMMLTLGLADQMAGSAFKEEDIYPPLQKNYDKVKVLADKWPSYEIFMSTKPDFVTGWEVPFTKKGIEAEKITAQHIPIFIPASMQSTQADLTTLFDDMIKLGEIFDVKDKADDWVNSQKEQLDVIQKKISNLPSKRVFVFDSEDGQPFTVFEGYTTNLLHLIGAENVMSGQGVDKTWAKTSWENVVNANPDYIIIVDYSNSIRSTDDFDQKVEKIKNNPQLQSITAVQKNQFLRVKLSEITPGVRSVAALQRLAEEIHGIKIN